MAMLNAAARKHYLPPRRLLCIGALADCSGTALCVDPVASQVVGGVDWPWMHRLLYVSIWRWKGPVQAPAWHAVRPC
jgi:hypothetical protein